MDKKFTFLELELSSKCNAACPQCPREEPKIKKILENEFQEITLENIISWFTLDFLQNLKTIDFKGSFSEPVIARDFYKIVDYFIKNTNAYISICTNGSLRKPEFWYELGILLGERGRVIFGIDGLSDTHSIYRVNTNYEKIIENAKSFIDGGGEAVWQFIIFKHNEHQIETAKQLANDLGFSNFKLISSARFESSESFVLNKKGAKLEKSINYYAPTATDIKINATETKSVNCKSSNLGWITIDWNGEVFPCCMSQIWKKNIPVLHIDSEIWYKKIVKSPHGLNLNNDSLDNILEKINVFYNDLGKKYIPATCAKFCGTNKLDTFVKQIDF